MKLRGFLRRKHAGSPEDAGTAARSANGESFSLLPVEAVGEHALLGRAISMKDDGGCGAIFGDGACVHT